MLKDLYTIFKCNPDQKILAENLQNLLMVISGQRDQSTEVSAEGEDISTWALAGVYDPETAIFYLRNGEHEIVQKHFNLLYLNRV